VRFLRQTDSDARRRLDMSGAQVFVLQTLAERPVRSLNELADRTLVHQSSVSVVVARLAARGLVSRRPAQDDARRLEIAVTAKGLALLARAPRAAQPLLFAALRRLPAPKRAQLSTTLALLARELGVAARPPGFFLEDEPPQTHTQTHRTKTTKVRKPRR
jgi:DNA-binding MarR family transcriptional regulator